MKADSKSEKKAGTDPAPGLEKRHRVVTGLSSVARLLGSSFAGMPEADLAACDDAMSAQCRELLLRR